MIQTRPENSGRVFVCPRRNRPECARAGPDDRGLAARLTQIDYDREMAFVATPLSDESDILAVARFAADPDNECAEYAITVRTDREGAGIGYLLLGHLVAHARMRGLKELVGDVLRTNERMLSLVRELGFIVEYAAERPDVFVTRLRLDARASASPPRPA